MTIVEFNIEANPDSPPRLTPSQGRTLFHEFINTLDTGLTYQPLIFNPLLHQPIQHSCVSRTSTGIGEKSCYLRASIRPEHVGRGEPTTTKPHLAKLIRSRGRGPGLDECGHIIARNLGGKMLEFNLFPQDKKINRGLFGLSKWWRKGVEKVMEMWLSLPEDKNPVVEFEIILYYDDKAFPDRPNRAKLLITLKSDDEENGDEQDNDREPLLHPTLRGELLNELEIAEVDLRESVYERMNWENFAEHFGNRYSLYALFLRQVIEAIINKIEKLLR